MNVGGGGEGPERVFWQQRLFERDFEIQVRRFLKTSIIYIPLISEGLKQFDTSLLYIVFTSQGVEKLLIAYFTI